MYTKRLTKWLLPVAAVAALVLAGTAWRLISTSHSVFRVIMGAPYTPYYSYPYAYPYAYPYYQPYYPYGYYGGGFYFGHGWRHGDDFRGYRRALGRRTRRTRRTPPPLMVASDRALIA